MRVSVYGTGYVGLIAGVCFANAGHSVLCYDIDEAKIDQLKLGKSFLYEPEFDEMLRIALENGGIKFTNDLEKATSFSHIHLLCVGTPSEKTGQANLSYLIQATESLAEHANEPFIVIIKSTVPVGTAERVKRKIDTILLRRNKDIAFHVVSCPEFLAQGTAVQNFIHPDRVIVGTDDDSAFEKVEELYAPFTEPLNGANVPIIRMSSPSAELTKYAANLFLATKISFMNEIGRVAEFTGADILDVIQGIITDKRIGPAMSNPGCGFGGSCLPKDLKSLIYQSELNNYNPALLKSTLEVNEHQKRYFIGKIFSLLDYNMRGKVIAIWGLAFKANTDDLRESVSCDLIDALIKADANIQAYDPVAGANARAKFKNQSNLKICKSKEQAVENADLLVVMTEWNEFLSLDINFLVNAMNNPLLIDSRNMYDPKILTKLGLAYFSIAKGFLPAEVHTASHPVKEKEPITHPVEEKTKELSLEELQLEG